MGYSAAAQAMQGDTASLAGIGTDLAMLAASLDARFVSAGTALANAYDIVERLVSSLEGVTNAMNRQAAMSAIETMRLTADRLTGLPLEQRRRQLGLDTIQTSSGELFQHLKQIRRTLSFLHVCGHNIKVAAAGADGFADFADHMFAKLEQAERQVDEFETEISQLGNSIGKMAAADRLLVHECSAVIPRVPQKLAADALALQQLQDSSAALAEQIAGLARDIRAKVAAALGALQIGDITRQRLEHISESIALLGAHVEEAGDDPAIGRYLAGRVTALVAAQAADTVADFLRESGTLSGSLRGIAPDAVRLAEMRKGGGSGGDIQQVLQRLEQDTSEIAHVTRQLCAAEADSARLGHATSRAADSLIGRLKAVNRIQRDVEQMAWNTALQCRGLGADGRGLAVISQEIQSFSRRLAGIWDMVSQSFDRIDSAARTIGDAPPDTDGMLLHALEAIRNGSASMEESLSGVDQDALQIGAMLRDTTDDIGCDAEIGPALTQAAEGLASLAHAVEIESEEDVAESAQQSLAALMEQIAARYTMAREREVHRAFLPGGANDDTSEQADVSAEDDDLFDDGLF